MKIILGCTHNIIFIATLKRYSTKTPRGFKIVQSRGKKNGSLVLNYSLID
ncbi:hypothetical protein KDI_15840 [Dictyobacter arantiisoli]|uniref:Uncharacterized protein n=1 Tax=Dictyobacter arantiisoli TaxID=2014874 RepID=A0A5A5T953_9CHLR|nr:hypothetical protein KDI_15840 [Dictyobacter arantiisoli]